MKGEEDKLTDKAIDVCREYDEITTHLLQRVLMIGFIRAIKIFNDLKKIGVISRVITKRSTFGDEEVTVGIVSKKRLRELDVN